ncbi:MAG: NAD(P)H-quinone oxidoreductase subunit 3, chloroplastic [Phycisphaerae bacterium]|nr:NAD(P)H-quinone oxidoreductase subunit 3, chloroplastic [Phycisphaerae bacterium]
MQTMTPITSPVVDPALLVQGLWIFIFLGIAMAMAPLIIGAFVRPKMAHPEKGEPYECGEPAIGSSWVQFDLRFYVVALVFVIFDVEIALLYPWAVAFSLDRFAALWDMLFFFGVLVVGFLYLWRSGYLEWVRATNAQRRASPLERGGKAA